MLRTSQEWLPSNSFKHNKRWIIRFRKQHVVTGSASCGLNRWCEGKLPCEIEGECVRHQSLCCYKTGKRRKCDATLFLSPAYNIRVFCLHQSGDGSHTSSVSPREWQVFRGAGVKESDSEKETLITKVGISQGLRIRSTVHCPPFFVITKRSPLPRIL